MLGDYSTTDYDGTITMVVVALFAFVIVDALAGTGLVKALVEHVLAR